MGTVWPQLCNRVARILHGARRVSIPVGREPEEKLIQHSEAKYVPKMLQ